MARFHEIKLSLDVSHAKRSWDSSLHSIMVDYISKELRQNFFLVNLISEHFDNNVHIYSVHYTR